MTTQLNNPSEFDPPASDGPIESAVENHVNDVNEAEGYFEGQTDDEDFDRDVDFQPSTIKRSKKNKIYCFHCNRQEYHAMAYRGSWLHSFLVGATFGIARLFGPYRCTCCGKKRAMYADYCSISYHLRIASERRNSDSSGRSSRRRSGRSRKH